MATPPTLTTPTPSIVKVYPDVALAMLRRKQTAAGRVWLLLRHLDATGRGSLSEAEAYAALAPTETRSATAGSLAICGRRQLGNLLRQGDGLFWERSSKPHQPPRIWLRSVARVAAALGVERLGASPVAVDITQLTGSIGQVRAHLYAAFHSSRQRTDFVTGRPQARAPIARQTLQRLSAASPNSQRAYERRVGVGRTAAFAVGQQTGSSEAQTAAAQETAWAHGRATFRLIDHDGRYGRPGRSYLAWQLPNEYTGPHQRLSRSRMKRMNRELADLLVNGMTGNDEHDAAPPPPPRRFFGNAKSAQAAERKGHVATETYWHNPTSPRGAWQLWSGAITDHRPSQPLLADLFFFADH